MIKRKLDERQDQVIAKVGERASYVMFVLSAAVIVAELIWVGDLQTVAGEMVIFLAGGLTLVAGSVKNGIWSKNGGDMTVGGSLLLSIVISGVFSVFYAAALVRKTGGHVDVGRHALFFFIRISLLSFVCLLVLGYLTRKRREAQEKKYLD